MHYTVLLQRYSDSSYIAKALAIPNCVGVGKTEKEALENVRKSIYETLSRSRLVMIDVDTDFFKIDHDSNRWFGAFKGDAAWGELFDEIERLRDMTIEKG